MGPEQIRGRPTRAEVDLSALVRNLDRLRSRASGQRAIAVVKANAYGHGAVPVSRALLDAGCERLGVATLEEALELRAAGIGAGILLLEGLHDPEDAAAALDAELTPVLGNFHALPALAAAAQRAGRILPVQVKFDTGMSRLGFPTADVDAVLERLRSTRSVSIEGVMSHLACADDAAADANERQRQRFAEIVKRFADAGERPTWIHLDSSPGLLHGPTPGCTAFRPGLALYGADPTAEQGQALDPVMTLVTRVLDVRSIARGTAVGYGGTYRAERDTRILTLPIGYADGLPRAAGNRFSAGVRGTRMPIVGRVSMDLTTVDAGDLPAEIGDEVLIFGKRADQEIRVDELAGAVDMIAYEILVRIGQRVPRVHVSPQHD